MTKEEVNKILDDHNKMLESMTFEEKQKYYAKFGIKITKENAIKRGKVKIYTNNDNKKDQ